MLKSIAKKRFEFSLLFFLFIDFEFSAYILPLFSILSYVLFTFFVASAFAYFYLFSLEPMKKSNEVFFVAAIALLALAVFYSHALTQFIKVTALWTITSLIFFVELYATFFMIALAVYFVEKNKGVSAILFSSAFIVIMLLFGTKLIISGMGYDDEMFIIVKSTKLLLEGINPYGVSFSSALLSNSSRFLPTVSLQNTILGNLQYPPLFMLAYAPFYIISQANVETSFIAAYGFYLFLFISALFISRKENKRLTPISMSLAFLIAVVISLVSAVMDLLLVAVTMLAYSKLESKNAWLFLGIAISLQELLWVPTFFMLVYLANEMGVRHAAKQFIGAVGVFLAISAWFMISKPGAFFASMFTPLYQPLPSNTSPLGFALIRLLGMDISAYLPLFGIYLFLFSLLLLYHNRKPMIFLLSMIVFLIYYRSIVTYYTIFGILFAFAVFETREGKKNGVFTRILRKNKPEFFLIVALLVAASALIIVKAHTNYSQSFNISFTNQSLQVHGNTALLTGTIKCSNIHNKTIYVFVGALNATGVYELGLVNDTIILHSPEKTAICNAEVCSADTNEITLNGTESYNFAASINVPKIRCIYAVFYSSNYYYVSNPICI